jgi:hypothetical protein
MLAQNHSVLIIIYLHLFAKLDQEINDEPNVILFKTCMFCRNLVNSHQILVLTLVRYRAAIFLAQACLLLLLTSVYQALSEIFKVEIVDVAPLCSSSIIQHVEFCATLIIQMLILTCEERIEANVLIIKHFSVLAKSLIGQESQLRIRVEHRNRQ